MNALTIARRLLEAGVVVAALGLPLAATAPVAAAEADVALIKSYIGEWRGRGNIVWGGSGDEETVLCRMEVEDSDPAKIGVEGRCSLAGAVLQMRGTIAWVEANNRYEGILSSNSFTGIAIGHRRGQSLVFDLRDYEGESGRFDIEARIALQGDDIGMDLRIANKDDGTVTTADVPFARN